MKAASGGVRMPVRLTVGLAMGAALAAVDNVAFGGEISPIVIVAMLLATTATAGFIWGRNGWVAAVAVWVWVPAAHLAKRLLGLPDTLHPDTYISILMLAVFSLVVSTLGYGCGFLLRRIAGVPKGA